MVGDMAGAIADKNERDLGLNVIAELGRRLHDPSGRARPTPSAGHLHIMAAGFLATQTGSTVTACA